MAAENFIFRINASAAQIPRCSALLNGIARRYRVEDYQTTLSIKSVIRGAALYVTPQGRHLVTDETFLVLNAGQEYSLDFQGPGLTETVCPFFQPGFLENAAYCTSTAVSKQLDEIEPANQPGDFYEQLYPKTGRVGSILKRVGRGLKAGAASSAWLEDQFHELAGALLELQSQTRAAIALIPAQRLSTREELYRRLHRARDYLSACYSQPVTVSLAAKAAHLSPYHFHRMFKLAFGKTPMQYLQECRLARARTLLVTTEEPVTSICSLVGFESLGSFSWLFRKTHGVSPREFRQRRNR